jgi:hypothetical protein
MARKLKNSEKETQTQTPVIWQETLKKVENEKCTLCTMYPMYYVLCPMARNLNMLENEKDTL